MTVTARVIPLESAIACTVPTETPAIRISTEWPIPYKKRSVPALGTPISGTRLARSISTGPEQGMETIPNMKPSTRMPMEPLQRVPPGMPLRPGS